MTTTAYDSSEEATRAAAPAKSQVLVTPANADLPGGVCKAIEVIVAGDVVTVAEGDGTTAITRSAVAAGTIIPVRIRQVRTGTTATVLAYY